MDIFAEYMVKKRWSAAEWGKLAGIILLGALLFTAGLYFIPDIQLLALLLIGLIAGIAFLAGQMRQEYEYSVTNGYVTVDVIYAKRSRKRLVSFETREVKEFDRFDALRDGSVYDEKIVAYSSKKNNKSWYAVFTHQSKGKVLLVFEPSEKILETMKPYVSRHINSPVWTHNTRNNTLRDSKS